MQPKSNVMPFPTAGGASWPTSGEVDELTRIAQAQAKTINEQFGFAHDLQDALDAAQAPPPATGTGTATTSTILTMTGVTGIIAVGAVVGGAGVPAGITIISQASGTPGGAGTYNTSAPLTLANVPLTFTPGGGTMPWPTQTDAPTLMTITQEQTALIRTLNTLAQQYVDLLNTSGVTP